MSDDLEHPEPVRWVGEPSPFRDNGPYESPDQAGKQFAAQTFGIPQVSTDDVLDLVLGEALLMAGVQVSEFEREYMRIKAADLDMISVQILAGFIIRSYLKGREQGAVLGG